MTLPRSHGQSVEEAVFEFIHSFNNFFLRTYYIPVTVLGARDTMVVKIAPDLLGLTWWWWRWPISR